MGNKVSSQRHQAPKKGLKFRLGKHKRAVLCGTTPPEHNETAAKQQSQCPAQSFLEAVNIGIYTDAFLLAGYGSSTAADLAMLSEADLVQIQAASRVPILKQHQQLILAASRQLAVTLGVLPLTPAAACSIDDAAPPGAAADPAAAHADAAQPCTAPLTVLPATTRLPVSYGASGDHAGSTHSRLQQHMDTSHQLQDQQDRLLLYSPCPLMNPFLARSSTSGSPAWVSSAGADAATVGHQAGAVGQCSMPTTTGDSSQQQHVAAARTSSSHSSSYLSARSASQASMAGSPASTIKPRSSGNTLPQKAALEGTPAGKSAAAGTLAGAAADMSCPQHSTGHEQPQSSTSMPGRRPTPTPVTAGREGSDQQQATPCSISSSRPSSCVAKESSSAPTTAAGAACRPHHDCPGSGAGSSRFWQGADTASALHPRTTMQKNMTTLCGLAVQEQQEQLPAHDLQSFRLPQHAVAMGAASAGRIVSAPHDGHAVAVADSLIELPPVSAQEVHLPGLSEIQPAEAQEPAAPHAGAEQQLLLQQQQAAPAQDATNAACWPTAAVAQGTAYQSQQLVGAGQGTHSPPAPAAVMETCWVQDLDGCRDSTNPFLQDSPTPVQQQQWTSTAASSQGDAAPPVSAVADVGGGSSMTDTQDAERPTADTPEPAAVSKATAGGPLMARRSALLRQSRAVGGQPVLSSPAVTAAAAAKMAPPRKHTVSGKAWDQLPGKVADMSYAATASLKTSPLPALTEVAAGQRRKQPAVHADPGVLTLNASQLPQRAMSESGFSLRSGSSRFPGLKAEESHASAAAALQQLARQQACNQELISQLLQAPAAAAAAGAAGAVPAAGDGSPVLDHGFNDDMQAHSVLLPEQSAASSVLGPSASLLVVYPPLPPWYTQYHSSSGSLLAPVALAGSAGRVCHELTSAQQPMGQAQSTVCQPLQQPQLLVLLPDGTIAGGGHHPGPLLGAPRHCQQLQQQASWSQQAAVAERAARTHNRQLGTAALLQHQMSAAMPRTGVYQHSPRFGSQGSALAATGHAAAQHAVLGGGIQLRQAAAAQPQMQFLQQQCSSASMAGSAAGTVLTRLSGTRSCMEFAGARAADVTNIVQRAKANVAAKQQALLQQHQQDSTPKTPVLHSKLLDSLAGGQQLKGAAAMLLQKPHLAATATAGAPAASATPAAAPKSSGFQGRSQSSTAGDTSGVAAGSAAGQASDNACGSSSLAAAVKDGDTVLAMLQEYKELTQLDKAVKSRMLQLLHTASSPSSKPTAGLGSSGESTVDDGVGVGHAAVAGPAGHTVGHLRCGADSQANRQSTWSSSCQLPVLAEVQNEQADAPDNSALQQQQQQQQQLVGGSCAAGVLQARGRCTPGELFDASNPFVSSASTTSATGATASVIGPDGGGTSSIVDAPEQSTKAAADQMPAACKYSLQYKCSPVKARTQHGLQTDQQQKLSTHTAAQGSCTAAGGSSEWARQEARADTCRAARQLWEPKGVVQAAGAILQQPSGPHAVQSSSLAATQAAGTVTPASWQQQGVAGELPLLLKGAQRNDPAAVAALVAAVAGGRAEHGACRPT